MATSRSILCFLGLPALAASAFGAASPVGAWKGHLVMSPQQLHNGIGRALSKMTFSLVLKKDHTFSEHASGLQGRSPAPPDNKGQWTTQGNTVTLTSTSSRGDVQVFKVSNNGREMTGGQGAVKVVFSR